MNNLDVQKTVDRILANVNTSPEPRHLLTASQQIMALPPPAQQQALIQTLSQLGRSSGEALKRLTEENKRLKQPPRRIGRLERMDADANGTPVATVATNDGLMEVAVSTEVDCEKLRPGQEVVLAGVGNAILVGRELPSALPTGEFDRHLDDGRMLVKIGGDRTMMLAPGGDLLDEALRESLRPGDLVEYTADTQRALRIACRAVRTREFTGQIPDMTWNDLGGVEQIRNEIEENVIGPICTPNLYRRYGVEVSRGVLLHGSPGTGKTSIIKATANRILSEMGLDKDAPVLFSVSGSSLLRPYVGEGPALIRALAKAAEDAADEHGFAMILLDDFEYCGLARGVGDSSSPAYSALTASLISVMQGLGKRNSRVTFMATANRPDLLDSALLRDGRFGTRIEVPRPGFDACVQILGVHLKDIPVANGDDSGSFAEELTRAVFSTDDDNLIMRLHYADAEHEEVFPPRIMSGAILEAIVRNACLRAIARDRSDAHHPTGGVQYQDLANSLREHIHSAVAAITPRNAHQYFLDLPNDRRVVAIDHFSNGRCDKDECFVA